MRSTGERIGSRRWGRALPHSQPSPRAQRSAAPGSTHVQRERLLSGAARQSLGGMSHRCASALPLCERVGPGGFHGLGARATAGKAARPNVPDRSPHKAGTARYKCLPAGQRCIISAFQKQCIALPLTPACMPGLRCPQPCRSWRIAGQQGPWRRPTSRRSAPLQPAHRR